MNANNSQKQQINNLIGELGIVNFVNCSLEESREFRQMQKSGLPLPEDIFVKGEMFFRLFMPEDLEIERLIQLKQAKYLKKINSILIFFAVVLSLSLLGSLLMIIGL